MFKKNVFLNKEMVFKKWIEKIKIVGYNDSTLISLINVEPTLTDFEKFHPPQKKSPLHVY